MFLLMSAYFFQINFLKHSFRNTIRVSNSLNSDQSKHSVGPDLGPNCLQNTPARKVFRHINSVDPGLISPVSEIQDYLEVLSCDPLKYLMDHLTGWEIP